MDNRKLNGIRRYDFYRRLGYSAEASTVLSMTTYGTDTQSILIKELGREDHIRKLYNWMQAHPGETIDEAASALERKRFSSYGSQYYRGRKCLALDPLSDEEDDCLTEDDMEADDIATDDMEQPIRYSVASYNSLPGRFISRKSLVSVEKSLALMGLGLSDTDSYEVIEEKNAKNVFTAPSSTFRMTTGSASMGILLNQIRHKRAIHMDQVRIEELLNAFDYQTEYPTEERFQISTELLHKSEEKELLYINVQASREQKEHQNIVLLLDVSGSMLSDNEVTQEAVAAVFSKLNPGDRISFVTYADEDSIELDGYTVRGEQDKEELMGILLGVEINGCTYGSAGIETAYRLGAKYYQKGWNNQVILITDGDLNFGITEKNGLRELIEEKKRSGLFLSVIGTGLDNYKDDKLETLAKYGNGTYCVINDIADVEDFVVRHYDALTNVIAKDVKAQVEFNPQFVKSYRLLGYENRELSHEDFQNDAVISEPYGSGGHGVALYELTMNDSSVSSPLRYMTAVPGGSNELCTVSIRYKDPLADESRLIEKAVPVAEAATANAELAYLLYCISETLRSSDKLDEHDRRFLDEALKDGRLFHDGSLNAEKLMLLKDALEHNDMRLAKGSRYEDTLPF